MWNYSDTPMQSITYSYKISFYYECSIRVNWLLYYNKSDCSIRVSLYFKTVFHTLKLSNKLQQNTVLSFFLLI